MPHASACSAPIGSASIISARARASPTRRGRNHVPPESGTRPIRAKACRNLRRPRREHDVAGEREIRARAGRRAVDRADDRLRQTCAGPGSAGCSACRSTRPDRDAPRPARPRGRRDPARRKSPCRRRSRARRGILSSPRRRRIASASASCRATLKAFSRSGRLRVSVSTPSSSDSRRTGCDAVPSERSWRLPRLANARPAPHLDRHFALE